MIGTLYKNCMDTPTRSAKASAQVQSLLGLLQPHSEPTNILAQLHSRGIFAFFEVSVEADMKHPDINELYFDQGGFGMPSRDYYESSEQKMQDLRVAYKSHIARTFNLILLSISKPTLSESQAMELAQRIFDIEAKLAHFSQTPAERRDPQELYHVSSLNRLIPTAPWPMDNMDDYLSEMFSLSDSIANAQPSPIVPTSQSPAIVLNVDFFSNLSDVLSDFSSNQIRDYLVWKIFEAYSPVLSPPFVEEAFSWRQTLLGLRAAPSNSRTCLSWVNSALGQLLGRYFIAEAFPGNSKTIADRLVHKLLDQFDRTLTKVSWMTPTTRAAAIEKLGMIRQYIGYPSVWHDYSNFFVEPDDFLQNILLSSQLEISQDLRNYKKSVDKDKWLMDPQTVNAYYDPSVNHIVFPAGILQPPFFNASFPSSMNFGAIGMVMYV